MSSTDAAPGPVLDGRVIRIASRTSPMAMAQAQQVAAALRAVAPEAETEISGVVTAADRWAGDLADIGGKGAFVKEIDARLLAGEADIAVHCMKDVPGDVPVPEGLLFCSFLQRDDARDCLAVPLGTPVTGLEGLAPGTVVGTSSVRRRAQLARLRPDLAVRPVRGNAGSRLARLDAGEFGALIMASAGLARIGEPRRPTVALDMSVMCPAAGAGIIGLECRADDPAAQEAARRLGDPAALRDVTAERALLGRLAGHCNSPIAGHCTAGPAGEITLRGMVFSADGTEAVDVTLRGPAGDPAGLGDQVAAELLARGAGRLIEGRAR